MHDQFFFDILDHLNFEVEYADLSHKGRLGECLPARKLVRLDSGMTPREHLFVLGHETCHAVNNDVPSIFGFFNDRMERRADEWSASMCIDIHDYRDLEAQFSGHTATMAFHLGVPTEAVTVFRGMLTRVDSDIYMNSRMGSGQWDKKVRA